MNQKLLCFKYSKIENNGKFMDMTAAIVNSYNN
jgi:hypothetical protein